MIYKRITKLNYDYIFNKNIKNIIMNNNNNKIQKLPNEILYEILLKTFQNGELITFLNFSKINKYLFTVSEKILMKEIYNKNLNEIMNIMIKKKELTNDFTNILKILNYYEIYIILLEENVFDHETTDEVFRTRSISEYTDKDNVIPYNFDEENIFREFTLIKTNNIDENNKLYINVFYLIYNENYKKNEIFISVGYFGEEYNTYVNINIEKIFKVIYDENNNINILDMVKFIEYFSKYITDIKNFKILYNQNILQEISNRFKIEQYNNRFKYKDLLRRYENADPEFYINESSRVGSFENRLYNFTKIINFDIKNNKFTLN